MTKAKKKVDHFAKLEALLDDYAYAIRNMESERHGRDREYYNATEIEVDNVRGQITDYLRGLGL